MQLVRGKFVRWFRGRFRRPVRVVQEVDDDG